MSLQHDWPELGRYFLMIMWCVIVAVQLWSGRRHDRRMKEIFDNHDKEAERLFGIIRADHARLSTQMQQDFTRHAAFGQFTLDCLAADATAEEIVERLREAAKHHELTRGPIQ